MGMSEQQVLSKNGSCRVFSADAMVTHEVRQ